MSMCLHAMHAGILAHVQEKVIKLHAIVGALFSAVDLTETNAVVRTCYLHAHAGWCIGPGWRRMRTIMTCLRGLMPSIGHLSREADLGNIIWSYDATQTGDATW